jgi:hypothetical protein
MTIPLDVSGLNFQAELGLGRATRVFYSVKQLKTTFWVGLGPKKILRASRSLPTQVQQGSSAGLVRDRPAGRAGLKMLRYSWMILSLQIILDIEALLENLEAFKGQ